MNSPSSTPTTTLSNKVGTVDNDQQKKSTNNGSPRKSSWRWWQSNNNKSAEMVRAANNKDEEVDNNNNNSHDCNSSIAQSSLVVQHSIHSRESDDVLSTTSIKSKPWISQKLKSAAASTCPTQQEQEEENVGQDITTEAAAVPLPQSPAAIDAKRESYKSDNDPTSTTTPCSSLFQNVPSITSSTVPVINFDPNKERARRRSFDNLLFSGIRVSQSLYVYTYI